MVHDFPRALDEERVQHSRPQLLSANRPQKAAGRKKSEAHPEVFPISALKAEIGDKVETADETQTARCIYNIAKAIYAKHLRTTDKTAVTRYNSKDTTEHTRALQVNQLPQRPSFMDNNRTRLLPTRG